eukprot:CAMPEP_0168195032 /NCGR_PEP_ID=MMETSP0139_2-20121125/19593_1 /TAXON_ID=44445 /ORGANISM="Pseudo-nitzschia australis, Strain 10249 10 AB" /LENGTH=142 /DNA_ID=CAMNT_0008118767 /DNA_START=136 /DNA_END=564 /DNA_ORIENTATION=-
MPLSGKQEAEMKLIFNKYSNGGSIGSKEIGNACRAGGLNPSEEDLTFWKKEAKKGLDQRGFNSFMGEKLDESRDNIDEMISAFQAFDENGTGVIAMTELKVILTTMGEELTESEFDTLIEECDVENGNVPYLPLAQMLFGSD